MSQPQEGPDFSIKNTRIRKYSDKLGVPCPWDIHSGLTDSTDSERSTDSGDPMTPDHRF